jgi:hypothetical protein
MPHLRSQSHRDARWTTTSTTITADRDTSSLNNIPPPTSASWVARIRHKRVDSEASSSPWSSTITALPAPPPPSKNPLVRAASTWLKRRQFRVGARAPDEYTDDSLASSHHADSKRNTIIVTTTTTTTTTDRDFRRDSFASWCDASSELLARRLKSQRNVLVKRNRPFWTSTTDDRRLVMSSSGGVGKESLDTGSSSIGPNRDSVARLDSDLSDLPAAIGNSSFLPSDEPSFLASRRADKSLHSDDDPSFDERGMHAHLNDVDSSFVHDANLSTLQGARPGADDTYLEFGPSAELRKSRIGQRPAEHDEEETTEADNFAETSDTFASDRSANLPEAIPEETMSSTNNSSSPTVAAAKRNRSRNFSVGSATKSSSARTTSRAIKSSGNSSRPKTPSSPRPTSRGSTVRPPSSPSAQKSAARAFRGTGPTLSSSLRARPTANRNVSAQSTLSSIASEGAFDGDYSSQVSGGSPKSSTRSALLTRLPSLGSMASMMMNDDALALPHGISSTSLLASKSVAQYESSSDAERPETPRANTSHFTAPTDTVIAQHVNRIQVPDTVARDFRARNQPAYSPAKRPASSGGGFGSSIAQDRPRRALTLKEQNGKIDKLTKENFDLKLKIHFLDQALQNRSDDGVKDLINQNVQFQTDLANERKETQTLRRKMRDMEKKIKEQEDSLHEMREQQKHGRFARSDDDDDPTLQAEMHEEILFLRQKLDHSENKITTLHEELLIKESEKRKMSETMRSMASKRGEDSAGRKETMDMWQDLLNAEVGRREQAEEDISKLRDELHALRLARLSPPTTRAGRGNQRHVEDDDPADLSMANDALLDQLKHENAELRRDLGAQTSMLTSRNRERERLQQEIEDLKLLHRKGDTRSLAGESIFDRSISRAHNRAPSRASEHTSTLVNDAEREEWDKKEGILRDQNAELRIKFQELERTHNKHMEYVNVLEGDYQEMEQDLGEAQEDLVKIQSERDEALQAYEEREAEYNQLREEALTEIQALDEEKKILEAQLEEALNKAHKTHSKLQNTTDGYKGLQGELREITQSVMNLEDEKQANMRTIQNLEQQITEAEEEIQKWESKCNELDSKNRKLEITQESLQSEVTFLREEQEGDKIKIGELEDSLSNAQQTIADEQEKSREMEQAIAEERQQRDVLENKSKEDVQKVLDDLNSDNAKTKETLRTIRRSLSAKEVEANSLRQKLEEYEQSLRDVLGNPQGSKQTLLSEIEKLQRDLESTANELDRAKMDLADKDRLLRHRDGLLESTSLESRRLSDLLEKERASRKHDLDNFEKASRGQASQTRTIAQQESRVLELESSFSQQQRKMAALEEQYRDQTRERNNLLLALWNRLSTLCGNDWAQGHHLLNGEVPSVETIQKHMPIFHKNVLAAVKQTEKVIGDFKVRIRRFEKEVLSDYQTLNNNLDMRLRRLDAVERAFDDHQVAIAENAAMQAQAMLQQQQQQKPLSRGGSNRLIKLSSEETNKLKSKIKLLESELKFHRQHPSAMAQQMLNQQMQLNHPTSGTPPTHSRRVSSGASFTSVVNGSSSAAANSKRDSTLTSPARQIVAQLLSRHHSGSTSNDKAAAAAALAAAANAAAADHRRASSSHTTASSYLPDLLHHRQNSLEEASDSSDADSTGGGDGYRPPQTQTMMALASDTISPPGTANSALSVTAAAAAAPAPPSTEDRMALRLREMERRLKAEREGRLLDREGAKKRLLQQEREKDELRGRLERAMLQNGSRGDLDAGAVAGPGADAGAGEKEAEFVGERDVEAMLGNFPGPGGGSGGRIERREDDEESVVMTGREFEGF